jgi:type II secretory pathway pseudopilin PulG
MIKFDTRATSLILPAIVCIGCTTAASREKKSQETLRLVSRGLDQYYLIHGHYPEFDSFEAMVAPDSVIVQENLIPSNTPSKDAWGQPFVGRSTGMAYSITCLGDPRTPHRHAITREPGRITIKAVLP